MTGTPKVEMLEYDYSVKAKLLSVAEYCERCAGQWTKSPSLKPRVEAYLKVAEALKKLSTGRYVQRLRAYGD